MLQSDTVRYTVIRDAVEALIDGINTLVSGTVREIAFCESDSASVVIYLSCEQRCGPREMDESKSGGNPSVFLPLHPPLQNKSLMGNKTLRTSGPLRPPPPQAHTFIFPKCRFLAYECLFLPDA